MCVHGRAYEIYNHLPNFPPFLHPPSPSIQLGFTNMPARHLHPAQGNPRNSFYPMPCRLCPRCNQVLGDKVDILEAKFLEGVEGRKIWEEVVPFKH